jgi:hypothetical protein
MRLEQLGKELGESSGGSGSPSLEVQHSGSLYTRGRHEKEVEGGRAFRGDSGRMQGEDRQSLDPHYQGLPKLPFPRFSGGDPIVWLDRCMEYFTTYRVSNAMWVSVSSMNLEHVAAQWWQYHKLRHGFGGWQEFTSAMVAKFGANAYPKALRGLLALKQTGTLDSYVSEFEQARYGLAVHNSEFDETFFVTYFVRGLKYELQDVVQVQTPSTVDRAIHLAQLQQEVLEHNKFRGQQSGLSMHVKQPVVGQKTDDQGPGADLTRARQLRDFRILNGLCYACGEKFEPGHIAKCAKHGALQLNVVATEDMSEILSDDTLQQLAQEDEVKELCCRLSVQALAGTGSINSMRIRAVVQKQLMLMLVDSGSSTSFVSSHVVHQLGLTVQVCPAVTVKVANGETMVSNTMVKGLEWWAGAQLFHTDMRVLTLSAFDAILGYDWLRYHSPMECDWEQKFLKFTIGGKEVVLQGDEEAGDAKVKPVTGSQLHKWVKGNDIWALVVLEEVSADQGVQQQGDLQQLLQEFGDVFEVPSQLPPARVYDHHIPLVPGAVPVNSRPYRYSPLHKDEIERQVAALLKAGLIVPSVSPFASPVLLVKKKDSTWRFCVDYRKLNSLTIKNRFPMPLVEEILDELAGTKYFSSLDLTAGYHQIRMGEGDEHKTAFKTHQGHYQFRVMPFGLTNAPATFQCAMNSVLAPFLRKFVMVFIDDILVYSATWEEHLAHIKMVLQTLREHQFYLKRSKCAFGRNELIYLGHIISHT